MKLADSLSRQGKENRFVLNYSALVMRQTFEEKIMSASQLHEDKFLKIFWDEKASIIGIDWKDSTSAMTGEEFQQELTLFAGHVEKKRAGGILVDVSNFRHKADPDFMPWRVKNISNRYAAAGVKREAFLFPKGAQIPPTMNQSAPGEGFLTRGFDNPEEATAWLKGK